MSHPHAGEPDPEPTADLLAPPGTALAVMIGNTSARLGLISGLEIVHHRRAQAAEAEAVAQAAAELVELAGEDRPSAVLLASTNTPAADRVSALLGARLGLPVTRLGPDLPVPIAHELSAPQTVGQDRLLAALGAFTMLKQACVVVDAGTALTVNFVDGAGVFHGGAILPGGQMMLDALHRGTDALPALKLADMPDPLEPFGRSTPHAMLLGVRGAVRGAVRYLAERYADYYQAYPQIIATGGDAELLLSGDDLIEAVVPDLVLRGIAAARAIYAAAGEDA